jgi:hypothetical protein
MLIPMLRLLRIALLAIIGVFVVSLVIALGSRGAGVLEKLVLGLLIAGLLSAAIPVRRIGTNR